MRRASAGSMRKCWPRDFLGRMPWRAASARRALGVSGEPGDPGELEPALPGDLDVRDALPERGELREGRRAEVDDPSRDSIGATIVDYHSDRIAVVEVGDVDNGPLRQGQVGGEVPGAVVPRGLSGLRPADELRSSDLD